MVILIPPYGLRPAQPNTNEPTPVPLTFIKVNAKIKSFISVVTITQFYENIGPNVIECEYIFPLDDNGVITQLLVQFDDGRELTAQVQEKKQAEETYEQAIYSGNSAILARTNEPDKMILNIGNLPSKGKAKVTVAYTSPLLVVNEYWKFIIPVAMTPLYNIDHHFQDSEREDSDFPVISAEHCPYSIGFTIQVESFEIIQDLRALNHEIDIIYLDSNKKATVTLSPGSVYKPDRDFILTFFTSQAYRPKAILESNDGKFTSMLSFIPKFLEGDEIEEDLEGTGEYIFILDRSGSMAGPRISMATQAAVLFLKSLPADCKFNIISFGNDYRKMFNNSEKYNRENMMFAIEQVSRFEADMGGTEILEPITHILSQPVEPQYPKSIFLLTDGAVNSPDQVVRVVKENVSKARVHAVGIGEGVSPYLIKEVAKAGKGTYSFVTRNEDLRSTVVDALQKTILPALTDWTINFQAEVVPNINDLSTIYYNEPFVVFARAHEQGDYPVSLRCLNTKTRNYETFEIPPEDFHEVTGDSIEKLWYKHKIRQLEHEIQKGKNELKKDVIDYSLKYQIPSQLTAYVAVEQRTNPVIGASEYVQIPISFTADSSPEQELYRAPYLSLSMPSQLSAPYPQPQSFPNFPSAPMPYYQQTPARPIQPTPPPPPLPGSYPKCTPPIATVPVAPMMSASQQTSTRPQLFSAPIISQYLPPQQNAAQPKYIQPTPPPLPGCPPPNATVPVAPMMSASQLSAISNQAPMLKMQYSESPTLTKPGDSAVDFDVFSFGAVPLNQSHTEASISSNRVCEDLFDLADVGSFGEPSIDVYASSQFNQIPSNPPILSYNMNSPQLAGYMTIVALQEPEGFWELKSLSTVVRVPIKPQEVEGLPESDKIWATLIALAYLDRDYIIQKQDWSLVQRKAKRWLRSIGVSDSLHSLALELIK
jgi:hypothetical protein